MKRSNRRPLLGVGLGLSLVFACGVKPANHTPGGGGDAIEAGSAGTGPSALQKKLAALTAATPAAPSDVQKRLATAVDDYFQRAATRRFYLHLDKPIYQPGEAVWFRVWELATATLTETASGYGMRVELVSPKGATVIDKRVRSDAGLATNDFMLPATVQGGEYTIRVTSDRGGTAERTLIVSTYQPPRIKKKAEFLRKAYGAGDKVAAAVSLNRATGEALASVTITAVVTLDDAEIARVPVTTSAEGKALVRFELPGTITRGDGLLTILVEDGGVTESLQKRIPITLKELRFDAYPEGGQLVGGLPGRVYFAAKNLLGKPADIEGEVLDSKGGRVARFRSLHNGMGRFEITPVASERYFVRITKPAGIKQKIPLPVALDKGCSLQSVDDFNSKRDDVRVGIWCSKATSVIVTASLREKKLGDQAVDVAAGAPTVVAFPIPKGAQGAVRLTVFDEALGPLAERLIYRGRDADLKVEITSDRKSYSPRDEVALTIVTTDLAGKPVEADLALAIADDTVLSMADDKTAHMLARLYLESEMPGQEIEEPNFYFSSKPKAPAAIDLVLGTQGWRRFEWKQVLAPPKPLKATGYTYEFAPFDIDGELVRPEGVAARRRGPVGGKLAPRLPNAAPPPADPVAAGGPVGRNFQARVAQGNRALRKAEKRLRRGRGDFAGDDFGGRLAGAAERDKDWAGADREKAKRLAWAPVRVFPQPNYTGRYDGPRIDFRETILWKPSVKTDKKGVAKVRFNVSDAVTSFRATAEGVSLGGLPGRGDLLVKSKLPVSLAVKMPLEVSRGDTIRLPVTLANETDRAYDVKVNASFGPAFKVEGGVPGSVSLGGGERRSFFATLKVIGNGNKAADGAISIGIDTSSLKDEVARTIKVVQLGFPQEISVSGTLEKTASHDINLAGALPGTVEASLTMYPSPLATMVKGSEGLIREPNGCFEQASSANYPNIMILGYLQENNSADPALVEKAMGMLDRGYKKIAGYESPEKGYEWFGGDPGHEALTAYGLMEFADMTRVYDDVDTSMVRRTQAWLKSRRDGKGGYKRNARALDSFGRASLEVTNGYITYALSETGAKALDKELAYQKKIAKSSADPYLVALAANTMLNLEPDAKTTASVVAKLARMQGDNGSFPGASHSITRSGGQALDIEATSLASLALLKAGDSYSAPVRKAVEWLNSTRSGNGNFSSTQSTILAMKAMTAYASSTRKTQASGVATLRVNGRQAGQLSFDKGHKDALVFDDIAGALKPGKNKIELVLDSQISLPYSMVISYRSKMPASSRETSVAVSTALDKAEVPMGEGVRMKVLVKNITDKGIPMTIARVGLPGGLTFQTWQLKELKDKKLIDFYETREREVVLYFRSLAPKAEKDINLELIARVPGDYVGPASRAYLYYTDEYKHWAEPVRIKVNKK